MSTPSTPPNHAALIGFLKTVPAIDHRIGSGVFQDGRWWLKFKIDIEHPLAWRVVQELGQVLNLLSNTERLPTVFKPVSPPVYLNGGPKTYLSWVIETTDGTFKAEDCAKWLEGRLPRPVNDLDKWKLEDDEAP
jgi:hypothetical protein